MQYAVEPQPARRDMAQQCRHREIVVKRPHPRLVLEEVDLDEPRAVLELVKQREWILDVLDHVERERGVETGGHAEVQIVYRGGEASLREAPPQILDAGVLKIGKRDAVAGLEQQQAVGPDPAPVVQQPRRRPQLLRQLLEVRDLRARHRKGRQVVQIRRRGPVERALVLQRCELGVELLLVLPQALAPKSRAQVLAELAFLSRRVEAELDDARHDHRRPTAQRSAMPSWASGPSLANAWYTRRARGAGTKSV